MRSLFVLAAAVCLASSAAPAPRPRPVKDMADCLARCSASLPAEPSDEQKEKQRECMEACGNSAQAKACAKSQCCVYVNEKNEHAERDPMLKPEYTWLVYDGCQAHDEDTSCPIVDGMGPVAGRPVKGFSQVAGLCEHARDLPGKCQFGATLAPPGWFHVSACVNAGRVDETVYAECDVKCTTGGGELDVDGQIKWTTLRSYKQKKVGFPVTECRSFPPGGGHRLSMAFLDKLYCDLCPAGTENVIIEHCGFYHVPVRRGEKR